MKEKKELINDLANYFCSKNYGDIVNHEEVERVLSTSKDERLYYLYVKKAKDKAIEKGLVFKAIPGKGWQVLKPKQVSGYTYRKFIKKALNMYDYSSFILENVDQRELSEERKKEHKDVTNLNNKLKEVSKNTIKSSGYYSRRKYYDSLKD